MAGGVGGDGTKARRRRAKGAALSGGALLAGQLVAAAPSQAAAIVVDSLLDDGDGANTTLREAVDQSNSTPGDTDVITFAVTGTIVLTEGQMFIYDDVVITGPGPAALTVDANDESRIFYLYSSAEDIAVTISGLTLTGGNSESGVGGAIRMYNETLTLDDMVVTGNTGAEGGGIWAEAATLNVTDSIFSDNTASSKEGGGIGTEAVVVSISGSTIARNQSGTDGGGVSGFRSNFTITGTEFDDNTSGQDGGGLSVVNFFNSGSVTLDLDDSYFHDNDAVFGGGLAFFGQNLPGTVTASRFVDNTANVGAGIAVDVQNSTLTVSDTTVSGNTADDLGGGVGFFSNGNADATLVVERSTISGNGAARGGGFAATNFQYDDDEVDHSFTIRDSTISGNTAGNGGTGYVNEAVGVGDSATTVIEHSTVAGNLSNGGVDGLYHADIQSIVVLDHTIVADHIVDLEGTFEADWSLVETVGTATVVGADNVTGVDPQLGPLQDNGGPTFTRMIPSTSPAHNAGDPDFVPPPTVDQRGEPRIRGSRIDIGAVERAPTSMPARRVVGALDSA